MPCAHACQRRGAIPTVSIRISAHKDTNKSSANANFIFVFRCKSKAYLQFAGLNHRTVHYSPSRTILHGSGILSSNPFLRVIRSGSIAFLKRPSYLSSHVGLMPANKRRFEDLWFGGKYINTFLPASRARSIAGIISLSADTIITISQLSWYASATICVARLTSDSFSS